MPEFPLKETYAGVQTSLEDFVLHSKSGSGPHHFFCRECGHSSLSRRDLYRHIESKHVSLVYACKFCGVSIRTTRGLQRHINREHRQEKAEDERTALLSDLSSA